MASEKDPPIVALIENIGSLLKGKKPPEKPAAVPFTEKGQKAVEYAKREARAAEIKKQEVAKGPPKTGPATKAEVLHEKFQAQIVKKGEVLTVNEKLTLIGQELGGPKADALREQFERLQLEIRDKPPTPTSRRAIESIVSSIPQYTDADLRDIAQEIQQTAFNHIMKNKAYLLDITIDARVETGKIFKEARAYRVYEDEEYLRNIGENIPSNLTEAELGEDIKVAHDLVKHLNEHGDFDVDAAMKTVRSPRIIKADLARKKIENGPEWVRKAAAEVPNNNYALSSLAELSEAHVMNPNLLDHPAQLDPEYLFMKGVQLRSGADDFYMHVASPNYEGLTETLKPREALEDRLRASLEGKKIFNGDNGRDYLSYLKEPMPFAKGAGPASEFSPAIIAYLDGVIASPSSLEAERIEAKNFKSQLESYNRNVLLIGTPGARDMDMEAYNLIDKIDHNDTWMRFVTDQPDLTVKCDQLKKIAGEVSRDRYAQRDMERGWSSLYLSYEVMKQSWRSPDGLIGKWQDISAAELRGGVYTSEWQEANKRNTGQLIQYVANEDYVRHRMAYLRNEKNWGEITALSGQDIRTVGVEHHRWFQEINGAENLDKFRKDLGDQVRVTNILQQIYGGIQRNMDPEKLADLYADFGDAGYPRILNKRNGLAMDVFEIFKIRGKHILLDKDGNVRSLNADVMKRLEKSVVDQMLAHKAKYEPKFKEWDGSFSADSNGNVLRDASGNILRRDFSRTDIEAAVNEVSFLLTATGQRAQIFCNAETPFSMKHQPGNSAEYAGQPAEGKIIQAMSPFRWVIERWAVDSAFGRLVMRKMFNAEAARTGIDKYWENRVKGLIHGSEDFNRLAKYAFNITVNPDDPANKDTIKDLLSSVDLHQETRGWKKWILGNKEGAHKHAPESLHDLTVEDLKEQLIYREGMRLLDARFSGAYHIIDSGWQLQSQIDALKGFGLYSDVNGVLLHETTRMDVGAMLDVTGSTKGLAKAMERLRTVTFVKMGKFDPISSFNALTSKVHVEARKWYRDNAAAFNIFHDVGMGETQAITADRPDLFIKAIDMRKTMIDTDLAGVRVRNPDGTIKLTPQGPIDYSKWVIGTSNVSSIYSAEEIKAMESVLKITQVVNAAGDADVVGYLNIMKNLSDFAVRPDILTDLANPAIAVHFSTVRSIDPRIQFLDSNAQFNPEAANWSNIVSATEEGHASGGGFVRWIGDTGNSVHALTDHLQKLIEAPDVKTFMMHLKPYLDTILYSGGQKGTRAPVAQTLALGWAQAAVRDLPADMIGLGGQNSIIASSAGQRAAGLGAPSLERTDVDHFFHQVEMAAGTSFHTYMPDFTQKMEKKFGLAVYIGKLRIPTIRLYNLWAFGLIGSALIAVGLFQEAQKGMGDEGGGGGGGGHH